MDGDKIALLEQGIQFHPGGITFQFKFWLGRAVVVKDLHTKACSPAGGGLPNSAGPDDSQFCAMEILAQEFCGMPALELSLQGKFVGGYDMPTGGQQQGPGNVGGGLGENTGGVADLYPRPMGSGYIDIVVAHCVVGKYFHLSLGGGYNLIVNAIIEETDHSIIFPDNVQELPLAQGAVLLIDIHLVLGETIQSAFG